MLKAVGKYYFTATKTTGASVRLPSSGYLDGPTVKTLNGWGQETDKYWRDIKGSGESKSWSIKVEAGTTGQTVALSWDKSKIPAGYTATLTDAATNEKTDMTASNSYAYTHTDTREFSIETAEQQENLYAVSGRVSDSTGNNFTLNRKR